MKDALLDFRNSCARFFARRYPTLFGTARVYEVIWNDTRIRVLDICQTYQSATYVDEHWCEAPFPYLQLYECIFETDLPMHDICMLGGGGFAFPKQVVAYHPQTHIDVVEIDPAIVSIARKHFFLNRLEERFEAEQSGLLGIYCEDALDYLRRCKSKHKRYDAILNDCFAANVVPEALGSREAMELIRTCLSPDGLYLTNVITALEGEEAWPLMELVDTLSTQFRYVCALPCNRYGADNKDNVVVIATNGNHGISGAIHLYDAI